MQSKRKPKFDTLKCEILNIGGVFTKVAKVHGVSEVFPFFIIKPIINK
jgi:hypothetical protein